VSAKRAVLAALVAWSLGACGTTVPLASRSSEAGAPLRDETLGPSASSPEATAPGELADSSAADLPSASAAGPRATGRPATTGTGGGTRAGAVDTPGTGGTSGTAGEATAAKRDPIKVGVITADYGGLVAAVGGGPLPDTAEFPRVLVKGLNARGGLAGRQIEPVYYKIDGSAPDYSTQYQAACDTFTRDDRVEVVIAQDGIDLFWACLLKAGIPALVISGAVNTDSTARRAFPNVFQAGGMPVDRIVRAAIEQSAATGWVTSKNKLGVLTSGCAWGTRVYNDIVVPAAKKHGVAVERFALDCPTPGAAALGEYSSAVQSAALQFRSNGVDRVLFAADNDAAAYVFFTRNADSQRWYPGYLGGEVMGVRGWSNAGVTSKEQAANTRGVSWGPSAVDTPPPDIEARRACLDLAQAGGAPAALDEGNKGLYYGFCDGFLPLRAALERYGGTGGLAALRPALEGLGTSYSSPNVLDGIVELGADRHEGARNATFFAFVAECSCFRHTAQTQPA
jgi:hypothetical protein